MPAQRYDQNLGMFVLYETGKAVTFEPTAKNIQIHSETPLKNMSDTARPCEVICGDCYTDGYSAAGADLLRRWEESGRFNDVIWDELGRYYRDWFPAAA